MISGTARPEAQAGRRQRRWTRGGATRLAGVLALLGVLGLLSLLLMSMAAPRLLGYQSYVIYGSSMEPAIKLGSLIVAEPVKVDDLQVGDIIVFRNDGNGTTVTHRIVAIREEDGRRFFQTKGDASNGADPAEVSLDDGAQQVAYHLPYLGYFVHFANSITGIILLVILPAIGLLALQLTKSWRPRQQTEAAEAPPEG
jgi:signal peptidase